MSAEGIGIISGSGRFERVANPNRVPGAAPNQIRPLTEVLGVIPGVLNPETASESSRRRNRQIELGDKLLNSNGQPLLQVVDTLVNKSETESPDWVSAKRAASKSPDENGIDDNFREIANREILGDVAERILANSPEKSPAEIEAALAREVDTIKDVIKNNQVVIKTVGGGATTWIGHPVHGVLNSGVIPATPSGDLIRREFTKHNNRRDDTGASGETFADLDRLETALRNSGANPVDIANALGLLDAYQNAAPNIARIQNNETSGTYGGGLIPEYPPSPEELIDHVREQIYKLTQYITEKGQPPSNWAKAQVAATRGGTRQFGVDSPEFLRTPLGRTLVTIEDATNVNAMGVPVPYQVTLGEMLVGEINAAEYLTTMGNAWFRMEASERLDLVAAARFPNSAFKEIGRMKDRTRTNYLGDKISMCYWMYYQMAKNPDNFIIRDAGGNLLCGKEGKNDKGNFWSKKMPDHQEKAIRERVKQILGMAGFEGDYAEQLAYNAAAATGISSEGNKPGVMSSVAHPAWIDRVFHRGTWAHLESKVDERGPDQVINDPNLPQRLLFSMFDTVTEQRGEHIRTIAGLLKDASTDPQRRFIFRNLDWNRLTEKISERYFVFIADAIPAFDLLRVFPDKAPTSVSDIHNVRKVFRNALSAPQVFQSRPGGVDGVKNKGGFLGADKKNFDQAGLDAVENTTKSWIQDQINAAEQLGQRDKSFKAIAGKIRRTAQALNIFDRPWL